MQGSVLICMPASAAQVFSNNESQLENQCVLWLPNGDLLHGNSIKPFQLAIIGDYWTDYSLQSIV